MFTEVIDDRTIDDRTGVCARDRIELPPQLLLAEETAITAICDVVCVVEFMRRHFFEWDRELAGQMSRAFPQLAWHCVAYAEHCDHVRGPECVECVHGEKRGVDTAAESHQYPLF